MVPRATDRASLRIVVAEDNRDTAMGHLTLLQMAGFHVVAVAFDGQTALASIREQQPHVAILDIALPTMDGFEVARHVRLSQITQPKLVAVTGLAADADRKDAAAAGFDAFLAKPIDWSQLEALLASYLA
jgi:CheY-like chemotaxis protein